MVVQAHEDLEPSAPQGPDVVAVSVAISLKRIADSLAILPRLMAEAADDPATPAPVVAMIRRVLGAPT